MIKCHICGLMFDRHDKEDSLKCMEITIQNMQGLKDQLVEEEQTAKKKEK